MAPRPVPRGIKLLKGTLHKNRDKPEPALLPLDEAPAPEWLNGPDAKALWEETAARLIEYRVLTEHDLQALGHLCNAHGSAVSQWRANRCPTAAELTQLRLLFVEFGMTPASRANARPLGEKKKENRFRALAEA